MASSDSFQRKTNLSFAGSEKESPMKRTQGQGQSPAATVSTAGNSKKGFFTIFSGKKKPNETFSPTKVVEEPVNNMNKGRQVKNKMVNRKNIADGRIRLNVVDNDRVPEDYQIEYRDDPFDVLDHNPNRTTSYIENLRSRDFTMINNREVKRFVESHQQKKDIAPPLAKQNLELDLIDLQVSYERLFGKFYRFFQGLLPGFCVLHIFLVFGGSDDQTILESYVISCLRLYQIIYLIAVISALGAAHRYIETRSKYLDSIHSQPLIKDSLNLQRKKYLVATIFFGLAYLIICFNREFIGILSNSEGSIDASALSSRFQVFRYLSAVTTGLSVIGWLALVLAFEEISNVHMDMSHPHDDLTQDDSQINLV